LADRLFRFVTMHAFDGQTDRQTDSAHAFAFRSHTYVFTYTATVDKHNVYARQ